MSTEWPHSVQDVSHSIQHIFPEDPGANERTPLLYRERASSVCKFFWIAFLAAFLCVGFTTGAYLLLTEDFPWTPTVTKANYSSSPFQVKKVVLTNTANLREGQRPNFLVERSGKTQEEHGWDSQTGRSDTIVIAFVGIMPSKTQLNGANRFLKSAEEEGRFIRCYTVRSVGLLRDVLWYFQKILRRKQPECTDQL